MIRNQIFTFYISREVLIQGSHSYKRKVYPAERERERYIVIKADMFVNHGGITDGLKLLLLKSLHIAFWSEIIAY